MMRAFVILLSLAIASPCAAMMQMGLTGIGGAVSGTDMTGVTFMLSFEDGVWSSPTYTIGTSDYSAGDTTGTVASAGDINASAALRGSLGFDAPTTYDNITFDSASIVGNTAFSFSTWARFNSSPTDNVIIFYASEDSSNYYRVQLFSTDEIQAQWRESGASISSAATSSANLQADTLYFITGNATYSGGNVNVSISVYNSSGTLIETASDGPDSGSGITFSTFEYGLKGSGSMDLHVDNLIISSDSASDHTGWMNLTGYP
jgi:hypothetical protein